jgi:acyl dehydratase
MKTRITVTIDEALIRAYGGGGENIHSNTAAANSAGFDNLVSWGGLTTLPFYDVMAVEFGEQWMNAGSLSIRYTKPVLAGDTIEYRVCKAQAPASKDLQTIELEAVTQRNGVVALATATMFTDPQSESQ